MVLGNRGARVRAVMLMCVWSGAAAADGNGPAAAHAGSAEAGRSFANAVCAPCHAIERGARSSPDIKATPFSMLVRSEKLTPREIEAWLTSSHQAMPDFAVPADKRADLIAYIRSLALEP